MECLNKFYVKTPKAHDENYEQLVPCGKCFACKMNKRADWVVRLSEEAKKSSGNYFVTLTYDDKFLPYGDGVPSLSRSDVPAFIKRLRKAMYGSKKGSLKYYAVGEYGTKTKRPHYHILFLDTQLSKWDFRILLHKTWVTYHQKGRYKKTELLGRIHTGDVKQGSIKYVAGYIINDFYKEDNEFLQRPFSNMSKGLGLKYITPEKYNWHTSDSDNRCYIPLENGYKTRMPKYLRKKIFTPSEIESQNVLFIEKLNECTLSVEEKKIKQANQARRYFLKNKKSSV